MTMRNAVRHALGLVVVAGLLHLGAGSATAAELQGVYRGHGVNQTETHRLDKIRFRVTNDDHVTDIVLEDYKTRCDGVTYTLEHTEFANSPKIEGDGLGHFSFTKTFYGGTSKEITFKLRGEFKRPADPRAVGIVRVGGKGLDSPNDWCGRAQEWKAWRT